MKQLHPASFGSTPGKMASSAVLQKVLSIDQLKIERRAGGIFDCDATGCYDRILPPLATIHLQALGLDPAIATFLARLMFVAKRYVKTTHGVSVQSIRTTKDDPLFGIGQGNGGGPAIWLAHLTVMFTALSAICNGLIMTCIEGIKKLTTVGTGYVDDVTLFVFTKSSDPQTEKQVHKQIKFIATKWEKLLYLTGGKLELTKCFWLPITWRWKKGEPVMNTNERGAIQLKIKESESGNRILIPRIKPSKAEKRLGILYSADGTWKAELQYWKAYTKNFATTLKYARVDRLTGYQAYKSIWCAKFRFHAPVVSFKSNQLNQIQRGIIGSCLSISGYNSKMPRAVVFGPEIYGGLNWESPYGILVYEQIKLLTGSLRLNDTVGRMISLQLQWLQLTAGVKEPLLERTNTIPYLPHCWITSLHEKLVDIGVQIKITDHWTPKIKRHDDSIIMDYVIAKLDSTYWGPINQCRLYLQAITFADITTFDGTEIPNEIYHVRSKLRDSRIQFPRQKRPTKDAIHKWQYFIKYISNDKRQLWTPLGEWEDTPYQIFPYGINKSHDRIYRRQSSFWEEYMKVGGTRNTFRKTNHTTKELYTDWVPVKVIKGSQNKILGILPETNRLRNDELATSAWDFATPAVGQILGKYIVNEEELNLLQAQWKTQPVTLLCGTDGGLKGAVGTSGYVIYRMEAEVSLISGYSSEKQTIADPSSTRQELLAQLCIEYWIHEFVRRMGPPQSSLKVHLVTDSQASIMMRDGFDRKIGIKDFLRSDMDVLMELARQRKINSHSLLEIHKVKSHISVEDADDERYWAVNEEADALATAARDKIEKGEMEFPYPCVLPGVRAICMSQSKPWIGDIKQQLYTSVHGPDMKEFLCRKYSWSDKTFNLIDWEAHQSAVRRYPKLQQVTIHKYIHGWLATQKRRFQEGNYTSPNCILCDNEEDEQHIFCCSHALMKTEQRKEFDRFAAKLKPITAEEVHSALLVGVGNLGTTVSAKYQSEFVTNRMVAQAMNEQSDIGWEHFVRGRISTTFGSIGPIDTTSPLSSQWARTVAAAGIEYGMNLWVYRNTLIHGNEGGISKYEEYKTDLIISSLYERVAPLISPTHNWLFHVPLLVKLGEPFSVKVAWLDSVRKLYPEGYKECHQISGQTQFKYEDLERSKSQRVGNPL